MIVLSKPGDDDFFMEAGEYIYPFEFVLPAHLPTSLEHEHGKIHYSVRGTIDMPWSIGKHTEKSFKVLKSLNLNELGPSIRQPVEAKCTKNLLFSFGGPIIVHFRIEKSNLILFSDFSLKFKIFFSFIA